MWAILLTKEDLTEIESGLEAALAAPNLTNAHRNAINRVLDKGGRLWRQAATIPPEHPCFAHDPDMRIVRVNAGTLAEYRQLLRALVARYPAASVLTFYEQYLGSGAPFAYENWDSANPPSFDGLTC